MGLRQRKWAAKVRIKLLETLGERCVKCGATDELELDCIKPTYHTPKRREPSQLASHYRKQQAEGNLQILCRVCNAIKGDR